MKEQIKDTFSRITMPEETEDRILRDMDQKKQIGSRRSFSGFKGMATAAAVLLLIFSISPIARAAFQNWAVKYFFPGSDITIYESVSANGETVEIVGVVDTEAPPFARIVNDRLYFVGNGEKIDITDSITEEKPYFYSYVDDYGLTHYMAVGYSGSIENYGIYEFIREEAEGQDSREGWITGTGRNFLDWETETRYPWVDIVWEELNIPWPMPE